MAEEERKQDVSDDTDSSGDESEQSNPIESLVTGRERRKTAGNRYDRDMVLEAADEEAEDEVALLFAAQENEEDEEFKSEASSDVGMSSSDDDDQGPNAGPDDLDGENELQKQAKAERAKKRKAEMVLTSNARLRKKAKFVDPTQSKTIAKKPSKKKERLTWLPDQDTSTARASLRKQTIIHREETLARLKVNEAQSKKMKVLKEKRDKEKAKNAPKAMTQADRLAEAERIERRNAKSLNRWEAMEKKRTEEQAEKLAALKNRKLEGPVITLWSGKAYYRGPRPSQVWKESVEDTPGEPKKRGRKPKGYHEHMAALRAAADSVPVSGQQTPKTVSSTETSMQPTQQKQVMFTQPQGPSNFFLSGIHEYAVMQSDATGTTNTNAATPDTPMEEFMAAVNGQKAASGGQVDLKAEGIPKQSDQPKTEDPNAPSVKSPLITELPITNPIPVQASNLPPSTTQTPTQFTTGHLPPTDYLPPTPTLHPPMLLPTPSHPIEIEEGYTTKNLIILNSLPSTLAQEYSMFTNTRKSAKPIKHNLELCPITMQPARYRDPKTGIGYANSKAYKVLQDLREHGLMWSSMLGCYVGREGMGVARGVPEGFSGR